jgi:hypothetical protein
MPVRRYEFRVAGRLPEQARAAFAGMVARDVPPQTIIRAEVDDDAQLHDLLRLIQDLGLRLVSIDEVPPAPPPDPARTDDG